MILDALNLLVGQLNQYVRVVGETDPVQLGNIAFLEAQGGGNDNNNGGQDLQRIVLSLVNLEEEKTLKNLPRVRQVGAESRYVEPPVHLNLYLLLSANLSSYEGSLRGLSQVIEFFQANRSFSMQLTPPSTGLPDDPRVQELQMHLDLHTLSFQEINDLWGSLGGKQVPFVMYKARLLKLRARRPERAAPAIHSIDIAAQAD